MPLKSQACVAIALLTGASLVWGHHSHGNYVKEFVDLEGVVTEVALINPHSWVFIDVEDDTGQTVEWALEGTNRGVLERLGVTPQSIGPGDRVKARCHPLRDGGAGCLLGFLQVEDSAVIDWDGHEAKPVNDGFFDGQ
ncbi:MAG: DUF6152 family protein [Gammaproteobacteria bacterium]|nr:DUF6152 family protein [Gammaproteobacteria bacterium]